MTRSVTDLWLVKVRWYDGGESVVSRHRIKHIAESIRDQWNARYQTDAAYVEQWDEAKREWPNYDSFDL